MDTPMSGIGMERLIPRQARSCCPLFSQEGGQVFGAFSVKKDTGQSLIQLFERADRGHYAA